MGEPHHRTLIRDAVVARLAGLPHTADRVYAGRTRPLPGKHDPALLVYTREEASERPMEGQPGAVGRELELLIEGRVSSLVVPDDQLDEIANDVERKLRDQTLDGLIFDLLLVRSRMDTSAEGERHIGSITLLYRVRYNDPAEDE